MGVCIEKEKEICLKVSQVHSFELHLTTIQMLFFYFICTLQYITHSKVRDLRSSMTPLKREREDMCIYCFLLPFTFSAFDDTVSSNTKNYIINAKFTFL